MENVGIPKEQKCNILMSGLDKIILNIVIKQNKHDDMANDCKKLNKFMMKRFKPVKTGQTVKFTFRTCKQKQGVFIKEYVTEL